MERLIDRALRSVLGDRAAEEGTPPLVGFADARDPLFLKLKEAVGPDHALPSDLLPEAATVVAFFMPVDADAASSNCAGAHPSRAWARAYVETKRSLSRLMDILKRELEAAGHSCATVTPALNSYQEKLISRWSHRHAAYIAGLGTFGLNNMLITREGCCGTVSSLVTSASFRPTPRPEGEFCVTKRGGSCARCVGRCPARALGSARYDRSSCYRRSLGNARLLAVPGVRDVCGKCFCGVPCSREIPACEPDARRAPQGGPFLLGRSPSRP